MTTLLDRYDALLLDLDGTLYHGTDTVAGAVDALAQARDAGVALRYVTNNASKSPAQVADHLRALGFDAGPAEVLTSAQAGAALVGELVPAQSTVLVVGTDALAVEVQAQDLLVERTVSDSTAAVIQGHSPDTAWPDLAEACLAIRSGAVWVACNLDPTLPTERGQLPGNGSMVAALRSATGREPQVAGKPAPGQFIRAAESARARTPLVVGDRLDTDIAGATAAGYDSLLVLTGVTTPAELLAAATSQRPRYLGDGLAVLAEGPQSLAIGPKANWVVNVVDDVLEVAGDGEPLDLLRALCEPAWASGSTAIRPRDDNAGKAARSLELDVRADD